MKTNKSKSSQASSIAGIDAFVQKHLAKVNTPSYFDPGQANKAFRVVRNAPNYDKIPPQYRALIEANKDQCCFGKYDPSGVIAYRGADLGIDFFKGRLVIYMYQLDASNMMATFEPVSANILPFFTVPADTLKKMSAGDRTYVETLRDVVNENVSFLFDVPFFIPDMTLFRQNEYGGKFIPEKYLVTGDKVDAVPSHLVDPAKRDIQKRWGFPIYDVSQVETGKIKDPSGCSFVSDYRKMKVVDRLILLNFDVVDNEVGGVYDMKLIQNTRAQKSLAVLEQAMENEEAYLKQTGQWTPAKGQVLTVLKRELGQILRPAQKLVRRALERQEFIYTLRQPKGGGPLSVRRTHVFQPAPFTSGRIAP